MKIKIELSTGKELELTKEEYKELESSFHEEKIVMAPYADWEWKWYGQQVSYNLSKLNTLYSPKYL